MLCLLESLNKRMHVVCRRGLLLIRGIFGFGAIGNYLFAVSLLPLNDTLVLTFTAPIWAAVLGPFLIKEKPTK
jgi:drug/metabolite transporter (DMT)-like permease